MQLGHSFPHRCWQGKEGGKAEAGTNKGRMDAGWEGEKEARKRKPLWRDSGKEMWK